MSSEPDIWNIQSLKEHYEALRASDQEAIKTAHAAQAELLKAHNDLLRKMENLSSQFATREQLRDSLDRVVEARREARNAEQEATGIRFGRLESWQAKVTGGMVVIGAIGLANFVKLWAG